MMFPSTMQTQMPVPCLIRHSYANGRLVLRLERLRYIPVATGDLGNPFHNGGDLLPAETQRKSLNHGGPEMGMWAAERAR